MRAIKIILTVICIALITNTLLSINWTKLDVNSYDITTLFAYLLVIYSTWDQESSKVWQNPKTMKTIRIVITILILLPLYEFTTSVIQNGNLNWSIGQQGMDTLLVGLYLTLGIVFWTKRLSRLVVDEH